MICYIGLGSNLDEPQRQLKEALERLRQHKDIDLLGCSSLYQSKALTLDDTPAQNDYINAVAMLATELAPEQLLTQLNIIEAAQGRVRTEKWGARTLDLDILLCDELQIRTDRLTIPHSQMAYRNFVIHPLFEIAGPIRIPGLGELAQLAQRMNWDGLQRMTETH